MVSFILKRLLILTGTLFLVSGAIFFVLHVIPGDPAQMILGMQATPEALTELRHKMGLDLPLAVQYGNWIIRVCRGDLGRSITYDLPIATLIASCLQVTGPLALLAMIFAVVFSIPLGVYAARHRNQIGDYGVMVFSQIGLAIPAFWAGILLILFFAVSLQWFSAGGFKPWMESPWGALKSLLLPALALGLIRAAVLARLTRACMLETLSEDYIRTARAKGLQEGWVVYKHALRNVLIPVVTILGLQLGELLAGAIVIENVFHLPGLGRLVFLAIGQRDMPVVQGVTLLIAGLIVVINFGVDIFYSVLDPRIRAGSEGRP
ncbi:MAG: ABC transporter permease [Deltaproteobacteria bacterium]|nr:ABC transporter permease [Deltaproteobacteria bacterium]